MTSLRRAFGLLALASLLAAAAAFAQQVAVYTAIVIPAVAQSGGSAQVRLQITSWTTDAERAQLKQAFAAGQDKGLALLRSMSKGYVNIATQPGGKVYAAFSIDSPNGKRLIVVTDHILSEYEKTQNIHAEDYPLSIAKIQFDAMGKAISGEVYPAAKVAVTPDGFVDVQTQSPSTATLTDIVRAN